jgi:hypothetical protein
VDAEGAAVVVLVALGDAALAFPPVEVMQHAVELGDGCVACLLCGPDEAAGHLSF